MKTLFLSLLISAVAFAADVTGNWSGTFTGTKDGETKTESAVMILKQEGAKVTGSGGPNLEKQFPIQKGKIEGNKISFEVQVEEGTLTFELTVDGDTITGKGKSSQDPDAVMTFSMKRDK